MKLTERLRDQVTEFVHLLSWSLSRLVAWSLSLSVSPPHPFPNSSALRKADTAPAIMSLCTAFSR